jgi:hypothetical protein
MNGYYLHSAVALASCTATDQVISGDDVLMESGTRGGGNTVNVWNVPDPQWSFVRGQVIFCDCVITAFNDSIYKSCDGLNLGGGGNTVRVYQGAHVLSMAVVEYKGRPVLRTQCENNPAYCDPTGDYPGGGPGVERPC